MSERSSANDESSKSHQTLVSRARELARAAHAGQIRKSGGVPYFTHLEAVAELVQAHGHDDPEIVAAAYLHDLIEDRPVFEAQMRSEMPAGVVLMVEVLSEPKLAPSGQTRPKADRFADYVAQLGADRDAARRATPISCADKVHNVSSLVATELEGDGLLTRLSTRPGEHAAQLATLRAIYAPRVSDSLLAAFDEAAANLDDTIQRWLPGRAVALAAEAHLGQFDKAGAPYIEHPMRLMLRAETREEKVVAILHDVVEDSRWTLNELRREGFNELLVNALDRLTRRGEETYEVFIERVAEDPLARRVKLLDLEDNADLTRIPEPTERDRERVEKYRRAIVRLRGT